MSNKALKKNEIAVAAVIANDEKILASAYNKRVKTNDVTAHAEILAIRKASKKIHDWRLNGYDMYVSLKPCKMCEEIIKASRLDNCFYLIDRPENANECKNTKVSYKQTNYNNKLLEIFQKSFKKLR